jgi:hypothetical protein
MIGLLCNMFHCLGSTISTEKRMSEAIVTSRTVINLADHGPRGNDAVAFSTTAALLNES